MMLPPIVIRVVNQLAPVLLMGGSLAVIAAVMPQSMPGFIENDRSLSYPIKKQTLTTLAAALIMLLYPLMVAVQCCVFAVARLRKLDRYLLLYWWDKSWCGIFISFLFLVFSEFIKRFSGKLRPNFFAMCEPSFNRSLAVMTNEGLWVTDYKCSDEVIGAEAARSFPSGHSMFAILLFGAIGLLLEAHRGDLRTDYTWATRVMVQGLLVFVVGPVMALSRFTEYYHHWSDVIYGVLIGYLSLGLLVLLEKRVRCGEGRSTPKYTEPTGSRTPERGELEGGGRDVAEL